MYPFLQSLDKLLSLESKAGLSIR